MIKSNCYEILHEYAYFFHEKFTAGSSRKPDDATFTVGTVIKFKKNKIITTNNYTRKLCV